MQVKTGNVGFAVSGARVRAVLYLPEAASPLPCVILANGFSNTMDWIVPRFAERFAQAGIAALIFDYRHLGESEGEPRQLVDCEAQLADLRAAISFVRAHDLIDPRRIALWGTSLGGSHVTNLAAEDSSIAALELNAPALDALAGGNVAAKRKAMNVSLGTIILTTLKLVAAAIDDELRGAMGRQPRYLAVYGEPGKAFFTDPALASNFARVAQASATWQNRVAARFLLHSPRYKEGTVERIAAPILACVAEHDLELSLSYVTSKLAKARHHCLRVYPVGHFEMYHGEVFERVVADQTAFLREQLLRRSENC